MRDFELFEVPRYSSPEVEIKGNGQKKRFRMKWHLLGFDSEVDTIKLWDDVSIKRVSKSERESFYERVSSMREFDKDNFIDEHEFILIWEHRSELAWNIPWNSQSHDKGALIESFFKIFFKLEVSLKYNSEYWYNPENQRFQWASSSRQTDRRVPFFEDRDVLKFERKHSALIRKLWGYYWSVDTNKNKAIRVAFNRFFDSEQRRRDDDAIIDVMIALEAIFLNENSELNQRLSMRISKFLEQDHSPELVYEFMKKAYSVRSKVAHGATLSNKDFKFNGHTYSLNYFYAFLSEILRLCLLRYVLEFRDTSVVELQKVIDKAIVGSRPIGKHYVK